MTGAPLVLSVVDTCTGTLHLVPVDAAARHRRSGCYPALCGVTVSTASLTTSPARHCQDCAQVQRESSDADPQREPFSARRPLRVSRLMRISSAGWS